MTDKERLESINNKWGNYKTETTKGMQELCLDFEWLLGRAEMLEKISDAWIDIEENGTLDDAENFYSIVQDIFIGEED